MTKTSIEMVREFHETFATPTNNMSPINDAPTIDNVALNSMRVKLLREEVGELEDALADGNVVEALDALTDIQYVLDGAYLALGFHRVKDEASALVHASNMSKAGADGKAILREDGKILKGPNYQPVNLAPVIERLNAGAESKAA